MRQVITIGAHIMNQNDQLIIFWKYHRQAKQILREQNISNLLQTKLQSPTETLEWYKKEKEIHFLYSTKKLAQYSLTSFAVASWLLSESLQFVDL